MTVSTIATTTETDSTYATTTETETRRERLLKALDKDGDGRVSKDEFKSTALDLMRDSRSEKLLENPAVKRREEKWARKLERTFARADSNHDGSMDGDEMAAVLAKTSKHEIRTDGQMSMRSSVAEVAMRRYKDA